MAEQSLLAKLGMRLGVLGSAAALAIAAPLSNGNPSMDAHTDASRIGAYFDRTAAAEKIGLVVMGTEVLSVGVSSVASSVQVRAPASTVSAAPINIGQGVAPGSPVNGDMWITVAGLFYQYNSTTIGPITAGGGGTIGGSIAANQVAFGSGANTIAGSNLMTFDTTNGFNVNMAASGTNNLTLGTTAGNSLTSGAGHTLIGVNAGTAFTTTSNSVAVGFNALAACTGSNNVAVGSSAGAALVLNSRVVVVGQAALSVATTGVSDTTAVGYNALLNSVAASNTAVGSMSCDALTSSTRVTAVGYNTLTQGTSGITDCTAIGDNALSACTATHNTAVGSRCADEITTSTRVTAVGSNALTQGSTGASDCTAVGYNALTACNSVNNVAVGSGAASAVSTSTGVVAIGYGSLGAGSTGASNCVAVGLNALAVCNAADNVAVGAGAADSVTTATGVVAVGFNALSTGTTGVNYCTAVGYQALLACTGLNNTAFGAFAGGALTSGSNTVSVGYQALGAATGNNNTAVGGSAASAVTSSSGVVAIGAGALVTGTTGVGNCVAVGLNALSVCTVADNVAVGSGAADALSTSVGCVAVGKDALGAATSGANFSTAIGRGALILATGTSNTAVGTDAGATTTTGTNNVFLGYGSGDATAAGASNRFVVGSSFAPIGFVYFGNGETSTSPTTTLVIQVTGGSGANVAGSNLSLAGGIGTGTGVGGAINLRTAKATTSSSTPNTLVTRLSALQDGGIDWTGIATADAPALSAAGHGTIYFDSTLNKFRVSENGGAYVDMI